jgi:RNA polymerase-associated protein LEO1
MADDSDDDSGNDATIARKSKATASSDAEAAKSDDAVGEDESAVVEEEAEPEPEPIFVEVPPKDVHLGGEAYHVKLPNFLTVVTQQFDADYYEQENEDEDLLDEEGRARLKLRCENSIRWRKIIDADGNEVKQSNAKFVRWSDGRCADGE